MANSTDAEFHEDIDFLECFGCVDFAQVSCDLKVHWPEGLKNLSLFSDGVILVHTLRHWKRLSDAQKCRFLQCMDEDRSWSIHSMSVRHTGNLEPDPMKSRACTTLDPWNPSTHLQLFVCIPLNHIRCYVLEWYEALSNEHFGKPCRPRPLERYVSIDIRSY